MEKSSMLFPHKRALLPASSTHQALSKSMLEVLDHVRQQTKVGKYFHIYF